MKDDPSEKRGAGGGCIQATPQIGADATEGVEEDGEIEAASHLTPSHFPIRDGVPFGPRQGRGRRRLGTTGSWKKTAPTGGQVNAGDSWRWRAKQLRQR